MPPHPVKPAESGVALLLALWAMLAMALLVAGIRVIASRDTSIAHARLEQVQLTSVADGMINLTLLRLLSVSAARPPVNGRPFTMSFAGRTGQISVQDEAGRIDLNQAQKPLLLRMLLAQNLDLDTAEGLSDKILDWREPGPGRRLNGAKAPEYRQAGYSYAPRNGPMESIDELRLVMGMTQALFAALAPALTVVSQNAWPDAAVAPDAVLRALPGMTDDKIATINLGRAASLVTAADGSVSDSAAPPAVGHAFTIDALVKSRGVSVHRMAQIRLTGILKAPFVVYQWR